MFDNAIKYLKRWQIGDGKRFASGVKRVTNSGLIPYPIYEDAPFNVTAEMIAAIMAELSCQLHDECDDGMELAEDVLQAIGPFIERQLADGRR